MYLSQAVRRGNHGCDFSGGRPVAQNVATTLAAGCRCAQAVARADHHDVLVLRNELNEHIRPGMLVWGVSKFSAEKKMKEQPSFYAFFIRKMVAPTGDPKEIVVEGEWLHALEYMYMYLRRLDKTHPPTVPANPPCEARPSTSRVSCIYPFWVGS